MERSAGIRQCRCGTRLARDNGDSLCAACRRASRDQLTMAPIVPPEFWRHPPMVEALANWHMGKVIRAYRLHPWHGTSLSQKTVGAWVHLNQTQLSRIENGLAISDLHKLMHWANVLAIPGYLLWFNVSRADVPSSSAPTSRAVNTSPAIGADEESMSPLSRRAFVLASLAASASPVLGDADHLSRAVAEPWRYFDHAVIASFGGQLDAAMKADGHGGSREPLAAVLAVLRAVHESARDVKPDVRRALLSVGARGAEFAGWLYRDARNLKAAAVWHDRATEWAQEASDFPMQGYVLLKRAQMAYDERDALRVFTLADAAQRGPWQLPVKVRAEVAQMEARGLAMMGEPMRDVERTLEASRQWLDRAVGDDGSQLATHYSEVTLTLQTASCFIEASQPRVAADLYSQALRSDQVSLRDQGYFLARRAVALALAGDADDAAAVGLQAAQIAESTESRRTYLQLHQTVRRLEPWATRPGPRALAEAVRASANSSPSR
ncbi:MAG: XRE family transcriptional regulator [Chloroflexota bacterium]|nr:XRE family transcriptional regulator [Chloroflexota bacterium]